MAGSCPRGKGNYDGKAVVAVDCEMVKCIPDTAWMEWRKQLHPRKKRPNYVLIAAHCAIVDYHGKILYNKIIRPNQTVLDYLTDISGVSREDMINATPFYVARSEVSAILQDKIVVGHAVYNDFKSLQMHFPFENTRDTATCRLLRERAKTDPKHPMASLRDLAAAILGRVVQRELPHSPSTDAKIALELYKVVEDEWERSLEVDVGW